MGTLESAFRTEVEDFLEASDIDPTTFGREALNDPSFVFDLRKGRSPSVRTIDRVHEFMERRRADATPEPTAAAPLAKAS